jgi:dihydroneopterin aldolase
MYVIRLKNCAFFARHGMMEEEERLGQRFYVDAEIEVEPEGDLAEDRMEATVNYDEAFAVIEDVITGQRRRLIEALALDAAKALCGRFPQVRRVTITVRKPSAPVRGIIDHVEVSIVWPPR